MRFEFVSSGALGLLSVIIRFFLDFSILGSMYFTMNAGKPWRMAIITTRIMMISTSIELR